MLVNVCYARPMRVFVGMDIDEEIRARMAEFVREVRGFAPEVRWVAAESWHPKQRSAHDADGSYVLEVPYSDDRELLRDVLKHGEDVEVLAPEALRRKVKAALEEAVKRY